LKLAMSVPMMKNCIKFSSVLLVISLLVLAGCGGQITVTVDGTDITRNLHARSINERYMSRDVGAASRPTVVDGILFAPFNSYVFFGNTFGPRLSGRWVQGSETVYMSSYAHSLRFTVGSNILEFLTFADNPFRIEMDVVPFLMDGVPMIPVQAAYEAIQAQVDWDESTNTMAIRTRAYAHGRTVYVDDEAWHMWATIANDGRTVLAVRRGGVSFYHNMHNKVSFFRDHSIVLGGEEISIARLLEILLGDEPPSHLEWLYASPVNIILDGINVTRFHPEPHFMLLDGVLFAPLYSPIFDNVTGWEEDSRTIFLSNYAHLLRFTIGSTTLESQFGRYRWGTIAMDAAPQIINGVPMIPVQAAFEAMQAQVEWNEDASSITISTREYLFGRTVLLDGEERHMWATRAPDGRTILAFGNRNAWSGIRCSTTFLHDTQDRERRFGHHVITMDGIEMSMGQFLEHLLGGTGGQFEMVAGVSESALVHEYPATTAMPELPTIHIVQSGESLESEYPFVEAAYTVEVGDTLWGIAQLKLGDGLRWSEIYAENADIIEEAARRRGRQSSENGRWIWPGTVLSIN